MKICFVSHSALLGGAERAMLEAIIGLRERGVACLALLPRRGPLGGELTGEGVEHVVVPYKAWWSVEGGPAWRRIARPLWNLTLALPTAAAIARHRCDIVYTNTISVPQGALAAALLQLPHVWHLHEFGYEHNRQIFDLGLERSMALLGRFSSLCLANSHAVAAKFRPLVGDSSPRVVYQSVTVRPGELPQATPPRRGFRCVVVGALGEGKRQEEAILAMTELDRLGTAAQLLVVGEGDPAYEQRLRRLVDERGLGRRVFLMGHVPNPYPLVESADAVLVCSRYEGFGRVTVEGMLAGKPVIGARSGGTAELIADGETGYMYTMGDHRELAAIVQRLAERPAEGRRVGERARIWARRRFTRERYASELLGLLRPLVRPHLARGGGDADRSRGQPK